MSKSPKTGFQINSKQQYLIGTGLIGLFVLVGIMLGTSSQGDYSDTYPKGFRGTTCTIEAETMTVGYSSYYMPDEYEISADEPRTPYIPVQCNHIPKPGMLNISIDLLYPESSRNIPFAIHLVKLVEITGEKDNKEETFEIHDILSVPEQTYPAGVITQAFRLDETGLYRLHLDGKDMAKKHYHVQIPIKVGTDWKDTLKNFAPPFLRKFID